MIRMIGSTACLIAMIACLDPAAAQMWQNQIIRGLQCRGTFEAATQVRGPDGRAWLVVKANVSPNPGDRQPVTALMRVSPDAHVAVSRKGTLESLKPGMEVTFLAMSTQSGKFDNEIKRLIVYQTRMDAELRKQDVMVPGGVKKRKAIVARIAGPPRIQQTDGLPEDAPQWAGRLVATKGSTLLVAIEGQGHWTAELAEDPIIYFDRVGDVSLAQKGDPLSIVGAVTRDGYGLVAAQNHSLVIEEADAAVTADEVSEPDASEDGS